VRIEILPEAQEDLIAGFRFYEHQAPGLGSYFRESILSDVDALAVVGGVHAKVFGYHRALSKRFSFAGDQFDIAKGESQYATSHAVSH